MKFLSPFSRVLIIAFITITALDSYGQQKISFTALHTDGEGAVAWNTNNTAPEPEKTGHNVPLGGCAASTAYYYFATADYTHPGPGPDSYSSGGHCTSVVNGFINFAAALVTNGFTIDKLKIHTSYMDLGNDLNPTDWSIAGNVESRYYQGGTYTLMLDGEAMISSSPLKTTITIDYQDLADCFDDNLSGVTDFSTPNNASGGSSAAVQACAAAFLTDVGAGQIRINFGGIQPAVATSFTNVNGRTGLFFENTAGLIEANSPPVPVELMRFEAIALDNVVDLIWQTATEINNSHFEIERSTDGIEYQKIGIVEGNGSTLENQLYEFKDNIPVKGHNYYRLKQIDYDGKFEYSEVVMIDYTKEVIVTIAPNPIVQGSKVNIQIGEFKNVDFVIFDITGKIVKAYYNIDENEVLLNDLDSGIYIYQVRQEQHLIETNKLIVID